MKEDVLSRIKGKLADVPEKPGVYLLKDAADKVLYAGKAKVLKNRLRSYFQNSSSLDERKLAMVKEVREFEYTVTSNELEAFVLEANLIKQYRPRYNVVLRDDKSYPYLKLALNEEWPYLEVVRRIEKDGAKYYGPYVPSGAMWEILGFIRNNFPIRTCTRQLGKPTRPCIQHQIKRCVAPCAGKPDHDEYMAMIEEVQLLLEGRNRRLLASLEQKMRRLSEEMKYEEAALARNRIWAIQKISEVQKAVAPELGDVDVIGVFRKEDAAFVKVLFIRNGIMIGSGHFSLKNLTAEEDPYLLKTFMGQLYRKEIIPPSEVLCPAMPEDAKLLSSWLSERRGKNVRITVPQRGTKRKLLEMAEENARALSLHDNRGDKLVADLASFLHLRKPPEDIGAFDISNIAGKEPVGAFVYWAEGGFRKENYRNIRMDAVKGPDDYSMMKETIRRTFKDRGPQREIGSDSGTEDPNSIDILTPDEKGQVRERELMKIPDLVIIDGGRAHLDAALEVMKELSIGTEMVGVAKDPDRVFLKDQPQPLGLEGGDAVSLLLRRIRDEAHRFAVRYHKKLRTKRVFESRLEKIEGVGKKRRFELLRHFGSIDAIRSARAEEIAGLKGFNRKVAETVLEQLSETRKDTQVQ